MIIVKISRLLIGTTIFLLSILGNFSYGQEPVGRVSEEEINTENGLIYNGGIHNRHVDGNFH